MNNNLRTPDRAEALRMQLGDLQMQYLQYVKIKEMYNVSFDLEMRRLDKAIALCRQAIHAHERQPVSELG